MNCWISQQVPNIKRSNNYLASLSNNFILILDWGEGGLYPLAPSWSLARFLSNSRHHTLISWKQLQELDDSLFKPHLKNDDFIHGLFHGWNLIACKYSVGRLLLIFPLRGSGYSQGLAINHHAGGGGQGVKHKKKKLEAHWKIVRKLYVSRVTKNHVNPLPLALVPEINCNMSPHADD